MLAGGYLVTFKSSWNDGEVILNGPNVSYNNRLLTASVTKDISSYDSFEFSILPNHKNYNDLSLFNTFIKVYRPIENDKLIFEGRIINISDSMDSSGVLSKVVTCEGLEGFLHDSMQLFGEYHDMSPKDFLQKLIDIHNTQVDSFKKIILGTVNVTNSTDNVYRYTEDDKDTYDTIQDKLVNRLGGEIKIRHENGQLILDYVQRNGKQSSQEIVLAKNLLSLTRNINIENFWTVLKPLGASIDRNNPNGDYTDADTAIPRVTIKDVNNGSVYIRDEKMVKEFGTIVKQKTWDDVTDPKNLLLRGQNEVKNHSAFSLQLQVSYVDLAYINPEKFVTLNCGDDVRVTSAIQGIDFNQRISSMTIDLLELSNSSITLAPQSLNVTSYDVMLQKQALADKNMIEHIEYANKQNKVVINNLRNTIIKLWGTINALSKSENDSQNSSAWNWPFKPPATIRFDGAQLFGVNPGGEFRPNGFHDGLDFGSVNWPGSEVKAIHDGTVTLKGAMDGLGNYFVTNGDGFNIVYQEAFGSASDIRVNIGDHVKVGDIVGIRTTDHLHVGVTKHDFNAALGSAFSNNGTWLDPKKLIEDGLKNNMGTTQPVNGDWGPVIRNAAAKMKVNISDNDVNRIKALIANESRGNQTVTQQVWDKNMAAGTPAQGLLQYVPSTFNAYAVDGHRNIKSGFDQLLAFFNNSTWSSDISLHGWGPNGSKRFDKIPA